MRRRLRPDDQVWGDTLYVIDDPSHPYHERYVFGFRGTADGWVYGMLDGDCEMIFVRLRPDQLALVNPRNDFRVNGRLMNIKNLGVSSEIEENPYFLMRQLPPHLQIQPILYDPLIDALVPDEWRKQLPPRPQEGAR